MKTITSIFLAAFAGSILSAGTAGAETGAQPHVDILCTHPAFVANGPTVIIGARDRIVITSPLVGQRAQNAYCSGPGFKHPADYGSAPEPVVGP